MGTEENIMLAALASGFSALILFVLSPNSHFLFFFSPSFDVVLFEQEGAPLGVFPVFWCLFLFFFFLISSSVRYLVFTVLFFFFFFLFRQLVVS